ncbi:hypothetical protein FSP39_001744 [Pinctada imbricata]|uniref:Ion transport domain-containing protein n=1 Tax=Pinctada imbricata TaxID=66713 RepID=A0AA89BLL4_PINIB|nr:hypothetical protein FSP39_001744 [Pinctada imbricata]
MPQSVCPREFEGELKFWGFEVDDMEACCLNKLRKFNDEFAQIQAFGRSLPGTPKFISKTSSLREKIWFVLDNQVSSNYARAYLILALFFVSLSMVTLSLSTVNACKERPSPKEIRQFLSKRASKLEIAIVDQHFDKKINFKIPPRAKRVDDNDPGSGRNQTGNNTESIRSVNGNPGSNRVRKGSANKMNESASDLLGRLPRAIFSKYGVWNLRRKSRILATIDCVVLSFFMIEMILRFVTCPDRINYFRSFFNILDAVINVSAIVDMMVMTLDIERALSGNDIQILFYFQVLRILRILRIVKNVPAIQVLVYSFRSSYKDLCVLLLYVAITTVLFGSALYCVEDSKNIEDIPQAFWLSLITMTTVGYGDVTPKTTPGKVIASLCAITGIMLLALVIPVFISTFINLYEYAKCKRVGPHRRSEKLPINCIEPESNGEIIKICWK